MKIRGIIHPPLKNPTIYSIFHGPIPDVFFLTGDHLSLPESPAAGAKIPANSGALQNPGMHSQCIGPAHPPGGRKTYQVK